MKIYVLTHKFDYYINPVYEPLLNDSTLLNEDFEYARDDTGDNISNLNQNYAELAGQYWTWKNSKVAIGGFCHYRKYFVDIHHIRKI